MNLDNMNAALESIDEEDVFDAEEEQESNDDVDESLPAENAEGDEKEGSDDDEGKDKDGDEEEGGEPSGEEPGEPTGEEEGGDELEGESEKPDGEEGGEEEGGEPEGDGEEEPTSEEAKKELLDNTDMPETTPPTEAVEIKDADDNDAGADDNDNKELSLDMEEVGALESYIESLQERAVGDDFRLQMGQTVAMGLGIQHGLESFGLDADFGVESMDDLDTLVTSMQTVVDKAKETGK